MSDLHKLVDQQIWEDESYCTGISEMMAESALKAIQENPQAVLDFLVERGKLDKQHLAGGAGCANVYDQSYPCTCREAYVLMEER